MVQGRCMGCAKNGMEMKDAVISTTAKGGSMAKGTCKTCGGKMCAMMSKDNAQKAIDSGDAKKEE